jgi:hypothetical protein
MMCYFLKNFFGLGSYALFPEIRMVYFRGGDLG